jgi:hypothetical protein
VASNSSAATEESIILDRGSNGFGASSYFHHREENLPIQSSWNYDDYLEKPASPTYEKNASPVLEHHQPENTETGADSKGKRYIQLRNYGNNFVLSFSLYIPFNTSSC